MPHRSVLTGAVLAIVASSAVTSCGRGRSERCGDRACPDGLVCDAQTGQCTDPWDVAACRGLPDQAVCPGPTGEAGYRCVDRICRRIVECGNGVVEPDNGETCDDGERNSDTAPDTCRSDCSAPRCGDGVIDADESCDGSSLGGATCAALGAPGGTLGCTGCALDDSGCTRYWRAAAPLDLGEGARVEFDALGRALVVWVQPRVGQSDIAAAQHDPQTGWTAPIVVQADAAARRGVDLTVDATGNAIAFWTRTEPSGNHSVAAHHFDAGDRWRATTVRLTTETGDAVLPQIRYDALGSAIAIWQEFDGAQSSIWGRRYASHSGWTAAAPIETSTRAAWSPSLATDGAGGAVAVWSEVETSGEFSVYASRYERGTGWGPALPVEPLRGDVFAPQIGVDGAGDAVAAWVLTTGAQTGQVWANRYEVGIGWGTPVRLDNDDSGDAFDLRVSVEPAGYAVVVWADGTGPGAVWAARSLGDGWAAPERLDEATGDGRGTPRAVIDATGRAVVVWAQRGATLWDIWANSYEPGAGWGVAERVETNHDGHAMDPAVALDGSGRVIAVWTQHEEAGARVWVNRCE